MMFYPRFSEVLYTRIRQSKNMGMIKILIDGIK